MPNDTLLLAGRILLAAIFILSGFGKLADIAGTAGYFAALGLPVPTVTALGAGLLELLAGVAVAVGFRTAVAAYLLAAFTFASGLVAHFNFADQMEFIQFFKNLAITGGFIVLAINGAGALSIDGRRTA